MTVLLDVASYVPPQVVPISALQERIGLSDSELRVFRRFFGLEEVRRDLPGRTIADLVRPAITGLANWPELKSRVRYVVHARTLPVAAPYPLNPLQDLYRELGLGNCLSFTVTEHACAGGLLAIDLCGKLLASDGRPEALALVVLGERAITLDAESISGTTVNGEAAAAVLVGAQGGQHRLLGYASRTYGQFYECQSVRTDAVLEFQEHYTDMLATAMLSAAESAGVALGDIAMVLPHNVNRISWVRLCQMIGYPVERIFLDNVAKLGHCFCADPLVNLASAIENDRIESGDFYMLATAGLGATFAAMVFQR